jgi:hypothetical protein
VCVCELSLSDKKLKDHYTLSPPLIDAMLQSSAILVTEYIKNMKSNVAVANQSAQVPYAFDSVKLFVENIDSLWKYDKCLCLIKLKKIESNMTIFDCTLLSQDGSIVLDIEGVYARALGKNLVQASHFENEHNQPLLYLNPKFQLANSENTHPATHDVSLLSVQNCLILGDSRSNNSLFDLSSYLQSIIQPTIVENANSFSIDTEDWTDISKFSTNAVVDAGNVSYRKYDTVIVLYNDEMLQYSVDKEMNSTISAIEPSNVILSGWLTMLNIVLKICTKKLLLVNNMQHNENEFVMNSLVGALGSCQFEYPTIEMVYECSS